MKNAMEKKIKQGRNYGRDGDQMGVKRVILEIVTFKQDITEQVACMSRLSGRKRESYMHIWRKSFPGRGKSKCKNYEVGTWIYLRNGKESSG